MKVKLRRLAHARAGDKGDTLMLSLIAYDRSDFPVLEAEVTAAAVGAHFAARAVMRVERYALPGLGALNFVLHGALEGGVTRSLALDAHGKTLSSFLLDLEVVLPDLEDPRET